MNANGCVILEWLIRVCFSCWRGRVPLLRSNSAGGAGFAPVLVANSAGEGGGLDAGAVAPSAASAVLKWAVLRCLVQILLEVVFSLFLSMLHSAGGRGDQESRADVGEGVCSSSERSSGIGVHEVTEFYFPSLSYSVNSCLGLSTSASARASRVARVVAAARVCPVSSSSAVSAAHAHATTLHGAHNPWSDTVWVRSHGHKVGQKWGFLSGRRFASCRRGGGRGKFSAGRRCTGAGCKFTSKERCGHTFPPPGGSWNPTRVTWTRIGHQAINGLDEGV